MFKKRGCFSKQYASIRREPTEKNYFQDYLLNNKIVLLLQPLFREVCVFEQN
jgi:hypothetical protein